MGSGFKDFTAGDVLTAAQVDGYLMRQSIMSFADDTARDAAVTGGDLEEGMHAYLQDEDAVTFYTGAAWQYVYSKWTSFTPTWTNLTIGNGTNSWFYQWRTGGLHVYGVTTFGSSTSMGTDPRVALPASGVQRANGGKTFGTILMTDDSTGDEYVAHAYVDPASTLIRLKTGGYPWTNITSSAPFTWATSDTIEADIWVPVV